MSDRYLWNKSGEPDPEIERLERLLGRFQHRGAPPLLPRRIPFWHRQLAIAASILVTVSAAWLATRGPRPEWSVALVEGAPRVGSRAIVGSAWLGEGEWLETGAASRASMRVASIGQVDVEPNTRLRLDKTRADEHRIRLERGSITAMIYAPARTFFVNTPSATAVDLGCRYSLDVDEQGAGLLRVILGWVGFEHRGLESFIPEGALCATRPGRLGTPYYEDSSEAFRAALRRFDFEQGPLTEVLAEARRRDALTLWHLLVRAEPAGVGRVYDKMAELVPPPPGVTREGVLRRDKRMHDLWWDALGLENIEWWRKWKGLAPPVK
ncbi:MAG: FecR domain-containing protein [Candidatus Solibacter usitatus]|nr:FecR domain-containing protein [Candidatus Solibacter usitatus]